MERPLRFDDVRRAWEAKDSDLALSLPQVRGARGVLAQSVQFPVFGSGGTPENQSTNRFNGLGAAEAIQDSPYAPAYALAERLSRGARTPYAYVRRVMGFLATGYTYDETPPPSQYPLETFLFLDRMPVTEQGKPDRIAIIALADE